MTTREFFAAVLDAHLSEDMDNAATEFIAKLDARNEKRKSSESKEKQATSSRRNAVADALTDSPMFAETIAEMTGCTVGQVRSALSALVRDGLAAKTQVKDGKNRKMAYTLPIAE